MRGMWTPTMNIDPIQNRDFHTSLWYSGVRTYAMCARKSEKGGQKTMESWETSKHTRSISLSLSLSPPVYTFYIIYIHIYDIYVYDTWYIYMYTIYIYVYDLAIWCIYIYTMFYSWYIIIYTCVCDIISVPLGQSWLNGFYFMHMKLLKHPYFRTRRHTPPDGRASRRCVLANDGGQHPDPRMILVDGGWCRFPH